jgi:hypothetical protein|tara:strand:+ start:62 stop:541 length:480 start_codon:yes stop_codon:yes gene_type:complete
MGSNFYRIPKEEEMTKRHVQLYEDVRRIKLTPSNIENEFKESIEDSWETQSVWDKFIDGTKIHLGKRSAGWKFLWNFNENKHYSNKEDLLNFLRSGRIVDEYGSEENVEEFIEMSLTWGQNGWDESTYIEDNPSHKNPHFIEREKYVDGLRVSSSTEFS